MTTSMLAERGRLRLRIAGLVCVLVAAGCAIALAQTTAPPPVWPPWAAPKKPVRPGEEPPPVDRPTPKRVVKPVGPRALSAAEREAVRLVALYLQSGPEPLWSALATDSPLRALGHDAALAEIAVRLGPAAGAHWTMRTPAPRHGSAVAIFTVEFPSGMEDTLTLQMTPGPSGMALRSVQCLVDPQARAPLPGAAAPAGNGAAPSHGIAFAPPAIAATATVVVALWLLLGAGRRRLGVVVPALAFALAGLVACNGAAKAPAAAGPAVSVARLGGLLPLRQALAGVSDVDRESLFARLPTDPAASAAATLWHADELLRRGQLNEAARLIGGVAGADAVPLAALLRGRLAFLRGQADASRRAFDDALVLGPDHDGLRLEDAQLATELGAIDASAGALQLAGETGSRTAEVYYDLAGISMGDEEANDAEALFRIAWRLQPIERATLLGDPGLAALAARPSLFGLLGLSDADEPAAPARNVGVAALVWPAGAVERVTGERLTVTVGGATLDVPAGAPLADAAAQVESAASRREREESAALERLPQLERQTGAGAWERAALRHDVELAGLALMRRERWPDLLQLTDGVAQSLDRAGSDLVELRAMALRQSGRGTESRDLLVALAKSNIANQRRDPAPYFQLAELLASENELDLAVRLYRRALALTPLRGGSARLDQLTLEQRLIDQGQSRQTAHFELRYPAVTGEKYATELTGVLEGEWQRLQHWIALPHAARIQVDLFPLADFERDYAGGMPIVGIFDGHVRVPLADLHSLDPTLVAILSHEMLHALLTERTHDHASKWLQEGLAQHVQMADQTVNPFPDLVRSGRQLALPVVEAALSGFSEPQFVDIAYGQAAWTVHFIETRWGTAGLRRLVDAYAAGQRGEQPLQSAFGLGYEAFDQALWKWATEVAPRGWSTEVRRYDLEAQRAQLAPIESTRRLAIAGPGTGPSSAALQRRPMQEWYDVYVPRVRIIKAELGPVLAFYRGGMGEDPAAGCRVLAAELANLLSDPRVLAAPDEGVATHLQSAYAAFRALAGYCGRGQNKEAAAALNDAERALGATAQAMKPWNLLP